MYYAILISIYLLNPSGAIMGVSRLDRSRIDLSRRDWLQILQEKMETCLQNQIIFFNFCLFEGDRDEI